MIVYRRKSISGLRPNVLLTYIEIKDNHLKEGAVILHPLARLDELDTSLDKTSHNLYFSQAHGAVFVRQALLMAVLGRLDRLPKLS